MKKLRTVAIVLLGMLLVSGCGSQKKAEDTGKETTTSEKKEKSEDKLKTIVYVPKKDGPGIKTTYEVKYDKEKNVKELVFNQKITYSKSTVTKSEVASKAESYTESIGEEDGIVYSYKDGDKEFSHDFVYNVADILDGDSGDFSSWLFDLADDDDNVSLEDVETWLQSEGYITEEERDEAEAARKERKDKDYEIKDGDVATLLKEAGYTVSLGSSSSASYTYVTLENLEDRINLETIVNDDGQIHEVKYSNRADDISNKDVYYAGDYSKDIDLTGSYIDAIRSIGITIPDFYDFLVDYATKNFKEAAPNRVAAKDIKVLDSKVAKVFLDNGYVFHTDPVPTYFKLNIANIEDGLEFRTTTKETGVHEIQYSNFEDGISGEIFYSDKHTSNDALLDDYMASLKELGITAEEFREFLKTYQEQYRALMPAETKESTPKADEQTTTESSNAGNSSSTGGTSVASVEEAIKSVDAKYDAMIAKAQGYVDNPSTFTDAASLTFLTDYTELMAEYAKLGESITAAGDDLSSSSALTIYTNMLTKTAKLTELYGQLN